jgi:hypothetical protein
MTAQNFSGRSIAYTRYTKAATLRNNDNRVMTHLHPVTQGDESDHRDEGDQSENDHADCKDHASTSFQGRLSSQAHHAAAKPTESANATAAGATVITHTNAADRTPIMTSALRRDKRDVTCVPYPLIRASAVDLKTIRSA